MLYIDIVFIALLIAGTVLGYIPGVLDKEKASDEVVKLRFMPMRGNSRLIHYRASDQGSVYEWTALIDNFLERYHKRRVANRVQCSYTSKPNGQVCDVPVDELHPCTANNKYNYENGRPCVFFKLDEISNWVPNPYNTSANLPERMPQDLEYHIKMVSHRPEANIVWLSCQGENPADEENIGPIQYIPTRGFPAYYYPYTNQQGYLSPLVAVLFEKPKKGVIISIVCKAWAKNIHHDRFDSGSLRFELLVDN